MKGTGSTFKKLVFVGEYMHSVGRYIVAQGRADAVPRIGATVFDKYGRRLGVVTDVFGPVRSPFLTLKGNKAQQYFARGSDLLGKVSR